MITKKSVVVLIGLVLGVAAFSIATQRGGLETLNSYITMETELSTYPVGTTEVKVIWRNSGDRTISFGEDFYLEKWDGQNWVYMTSTIEFTLMGYEVRPGDEVEHLYDFRILFDEHGNRIFHRGYCLSNDIVLFEGRYRIRTRYTNIDRAESEELVRTEVYAVFTVS